MSLSKEDKQEIMELIQEALRGGSVDMPAKADAGTGTGTGTRAYSYMKQAQEWEKDGIMSRLTNLLIAPADLYVELPDGTTKTLFVYDEAEAAISNLPDGWRLPTRSEWVLIAEEFGNDPVTGELSSQLIRDVLGLGLNGSVDITNITRDVGAVGFYWSSTRYGSDLMYTLYFDTSNVAPAISSGRDYGYSVRCVRGAA